MIIFPYFIGNNTADKMETLDGNVASAPGMGLSPRALEALGKAAGWGKFISIAGICVVGIYLIILLAGLASTISFISYAPQMLLITAAWLGMYILILICLIRMLQFSFSASKAVQMHNSMALENAMVKLKGYFSLTGIATIIGLGLVLVFFIIMAFFGFAFGNGFGRF